MRYLLSAVIAAASVAVLPLPAGAQPVTVTVPYSGPPPVDPRVFQPQFQFPHYNLYGTPYNFDFDPAAAAINAELAIHPRTRQLRLDYGLAVTLARTGETAMQHYLKCQAAYASYDLTTDTWLDNGFPRRCRL
jgi:hypothetical protein